MAEPCMGVLLVVRSNLFLFAAKAVSALPAEISIPSSAPLPCLSKSFNVFTDIAFLPFHKSFASFSAEIVLCSIVFFILFATLFFVCSVNSTKLNILLPALSVFFIPLGVAGSRTSCSGNAPDCGSRRPSPAANDRRGTLPGCPQPGHRLRCSRRRGSVWSPSGQS